MAGQEYSIRQSHTGSDNIWTVTVMKKGTYVIEYHIFEENKHSYTVRVPTDLSRSLYTADSLGEAISQIVNKEES